MDEWDNIFSAVILTRNIIIVMSLDQQEIKVFYNKENNYFYVFRTAIKKRIAL